MLMTLVCCGTGVSAGSTTSCFSSRCIKCEGASVRLAIIGAMAARLILFSCLGAVFGKVYEPCELARELLDVHEIPEKQIATWVCLARHESEYNTAAVNRGSGDHGLFQISQLFWCSPPGYACGVSCDDLHDDDIEDDVICARRIYREHQRLSGDGFNAWVVYHQHCNNKNYANGLIAGCDLTGKTLRGKNATELPAVDYYPQFKSRVKGAANKEGGKTIYPPAKTEKYGNNALKSSQYATSKEYTKKTTSTQFYQESKPSITTKFPVKSTPYSSFSTSSNSRYTPPFRTNTGSGISSGSSYNPGSSFSTGNSLNRGSSFSTGTTINSGSSYNTGTTLNSGSSYNNGNSFNTGTTLNRGSSYNTGNSLNAGTILNSGSSYNTGSSFNTGTSGSSTNFGSINRFSQGKEPKRTTYSHQPTTQKSPYTFKTTKTPPSSTQKAFSYSINKTGFRFERTSL